MVSEGCHQANNFHSGDILELLCLVPTCTNPCTQQVFSKNIYQIDIGKLRAGIGDGPERLTHTQSEIQTDHQLNTSEELIKNQGKCRRTFLSYSITLWEI